MPTGRVRRNRWGSVSPITYNPLIVLRPESNAIAMHSSYRKSLLAPLAFVFFSLSSAYSDIIIEVVRSPGGEIIGPTAFFEVGIESEFEIASVTASVEGREALLEYKPVPWGPILLPRWSGSLDLEGLSGEFNGSVTAVDVLGNKQTVETGSFTYVVDNPPELIITSPYHYSVATPHIRVAAKCTDDSGEDCDFLIEIVADRNETTVFQSTASEIDERFDLSTYEGSEIVLRITVLDTKGQSAVRESIVYVESNPRLSPIQTVPGSILDTSESRILYTENRENIHSLEVFDRSTGESSNIYTNPGVSIQPHLSFLTPLGAIFVERMEDSTQFRLVDARGDEIVDLGKPDSNSSLLVKGKYAIWNNSKTLFLRDLISGSNTIIAENAGNWRNDLTAEGSVAYWGTTEENHQIFIYRNGASVQLTNDSEYRSYSVRTDGENTIYTKDREILGQRFYQIAFHNGTAESIVLDTGMDELNVGSEYDLVDGWIAFVKPGSSGQRQVWMHRVGESPRQRSLFFSGSLMIEINERGELIFENEQRDSKYISHPSGRFIKLGNYIGETIWQDGRWQVVIGNTLFALDTRRVPIPNILGFQKSDSGALQLEFEAESGETLMLQSSENMQDWTDIREIDPTETDIDIGDLSEGDSSTVFYRILVE